MISLSTIMKGGSFRDLREKVDGFDKAMLQMQKLQATRPAGRGIYIVKEIPKKLEISLRLLKFLFLRNRSKISNYDLRSLGVK